MFSGSFSTPQEQTRSKLPPGAGGGESIVLGVEAARHGLGCCISRMVLCSILAPNRHSANGERV